MGSESIRAQYCEGPLEHVVISFTITGAYGSTSIPLQENESFDTFPEQHASNANIGLGEGRIWSNMSTLKSDKITKPTLKATL